MADYVTSASRLSLVTTYLDAYFSRKIQAARDIHPRYETLWREAARVSAHGKRLRPQMVLLAYEAFGGTDPSRIVPAAAACELLHVAMLIHDDIIDRDTVRHGEPTIESAYRTRYAGEVTDQADREHNALAAALLAGDLLLSDARSLITKADAPAELLARAGFAFDQAVFEVAGGELLDVESAGAPRGSVDSLTVMAYKTASYSFVGPLLIGAALAGATVKSQHAMREFALSLGIAYQLTDDILGVFGDSAETGKSNCGDIAEGKATYLVERFYALAPAGDVTVFEHEYGNKDVTAAGCLAVRELLRSSGALAETERAVRYYADRAVKQLESFGLDAAARGGFEELIALCTERRA